jgi:hypothetical protein
MKLGRRNHTLPLFNHQALYKEKARPFQVGPDAALRSYYASPTIARYLYRLNFDSITTSRKVSRRTSQRGKNPKTLKEQSCICQNGEMPRSSPKITATEMTRTQAVIPNSTTQILRTRSCSGPRKAMASPGGRSQPIGAVQQKRILTICLQQTLMNMSNPG